MRGLIGEGADEGFDKEGADDRVERAVRRPPRR